MKKCFLIFLILNGISFTQTDLYSEGLNSVYARDVFRVFAVGNNGLIIKSLDGGMNWGNYSIGSTNYNSIHGVGQYIWIVGDGGSVLTSSNGGNTFQLTSFYEGINLRSVYFVNLSTGWISGNSGYMYYTTNGGLGWSQQATYTSNNLNSVRFTDPQNGVSCGDNGIVLRTSNGGLNWNSVSVPVTKNLLSADIYGSTIYLSGLDATFLKSTNSGSSWNIIDFKITTRSDVNGIFALDSLSFYSVGVGGFIRKSTDGGISFKFLPGPIFPDLANIYFRDNNYGWAVSRNTNVVLRTSDGGTSWNFPTGVTQTLSWTRTLQTPYYTSSGNVFCTSAFNKNEIFIANLNKIYRSLDRGSSWTQISSIPYAALGNQATTNSLLVSPKDTNIFLVAIDSNYDHGKVYRSTNYGGNWVVTKTSYRVADGIPLAMDPNHTDTIYYGTTDSVIFRSTNFGLTWAPTGPKIFAYNCSMKVLEGASNIIFCGAAEDTAIGLSYLYKSTNYGLSWIAVDSNSTPGYPELPAIVNSIMNPNTLFASFFEGSQGGLKRSTNQGSIWNFMNIDNVVWGLDIAKDDPNVICYGDGYNFVNNITYYSIDGGIHFSALPVLNSANFAVFFYNRNTLLLQQSLGFYKLNIDYSNPIGIRPIATEVPKKFLLYQNYPNPFNPVTKIDFDLSNESNVKLKVYNIQGQIVGTLINDELKPAGSYSVTLDASSLASGVYFYQLEALAGSTNQLFVESRKMVLIR